MTRKEKIKGAYRQLGGSASFYDGMITCSTLPGKAVCGLVWNMDGEKTDWFIEHLYVRKGYFTPPFETKKSLTERLSGMYEKAGVSSVEGIGCFRCRK